MPNHGKLWKSLMRAHLPNCDELEIRLRNRSQNLIQNI